MNSDQDAAKRLQQDLSATSADKPPVRTYRSRSTVWGSPLVLFVLGLLVLAVIGGGSYVLLSDGDAGNERVASPAIGHARTDLVGVGPDIHAAARNAVANAGIYRKFDYTITNVKQVDDWAWVSGYMSRESDVYSPDGFTLLAHREGKMWRAAPPGRQVGQSWWLCQAPTPLVSRDEQQYFLGHPCP